MRKVIRHRGTGAFFSKGRWVEDIRRAQEFPSLESLFDAEEEYHLTNIEIYCCVADEKIDPFADWAFPLSREVDGEEPGAPGFA